MTLHKKRHSRRSRTPLRNPRPDGGTVPTTSATELRTALPKDSNTTGSTPPRHYTIHNHTRPTHQPLKRRQIANFDLIFRRGYGSPIAVHVKTKPPRGGESEILARPLLPDRGLESGFHAPNREGLDEHAGLNGHVQRALDVEALGGLRRPILLLAAMRLGISCSANVNSLHPNLPTSP